MPVGGASRVLQQVIESWGGVGQRVTLEGRFRAVVVLSDQRKLAQVGHEDELARLPVGIYLSGGDQHIEIGVGALNLDHAAIRVGVLAGEEAEVWLAGGGFAVVDNGADLGLQFVADGVEEIVQRGVVGKLRRPDAADRRDGVEVLLDGLTEFGHVGVPHLTRRRRIRRLPTR